jgi:hypothetical protein
VSIKHIEVHKVDENESVAFLSVPMRGNQDQSCHSEGPPLAITDRLDARQSSFPRVSRVQ